MRETQPSLKDCLIIYLAIELISSVSNDSFKFCTHNHFNRTVSIFDLLGRIDEQQRTALYKALLYKSRYRANVMETARNKHMR